MNAVVYSDASYCHKTDIAACGFLVIYNGKIIKHVVYLVSALKTPTKAEAWALTEGLQYAFLLERVGRISAYTDCLTVVRSVTYSKKYTELLITIDIIREHGIGFNLHHVRGHSTNKYNTMIDRSCNQQLKEYLKINHG